MAGDANKARDLLVAHFMHNIEYISSRFYIGQILAVCQAVYVQEIDVIGVQPAEAAFDNSLRLVSIASIYFGRKEDVLPPGGHEFTHPGLALSVAVPVCR